MSIPTHIARCQTDGVAIVSVTHITDFRLPRINHGGVRRWLGHGGLPTLPCMGVPQRSLSFVPLLIAVTATCASALEPYEATTQERRMVELVNHERVSRGFEPLAIDQRLGAIARAHSAEMRGEDRIFHDSPITGSPGDRLRAAGYAYRVVRENVALDTVLEDAHEGLMQSPGHRANILSPDITRIGIGIVEQERQGRPPRLFITQVFADPSRQRSPGASLSALQDRMQKARESASLKPLSRPESLDALVKRSLERVGDPLASDALDRIGPRLRKELETLDGGRWRRTELSLQVVADAEEWRVPSGVSEGRLGAAGIATAQAKDSKGNPRLVVLLLLAGR